MQKLIFLITLSGFIALAVYSYHRSPPSRPYSMMVHPAKWRTARAAMIADIFGITPEEVSSPVILWRD